MDEFWLIAAAGWHAPYTVSGPVQPASRGVLARTGPTRPSSWTVHSQRGFTGRATQSLLIAFAFFAFSGCGRTAPPPKPQVKRENPLALARELYRTAAESAQFRDANERTNAYLAGNPDTLPAHYPGTKDQAKLQALLNKQSPSADVAKLDSHALYQKFLETIVGLDKSEIDETESNSFTLMDAHYLEGCYLFREVAGSMPLRTLTPLEQAEYCFAWVTRQVVLQKGRDELLPPQYVLRRGQGSPAERVLVFLALLQQVTPAADATSPHLDGCLIALPAAAGQPRPWLAGVLVSDATQRDVYLFDPRLGLGVPGPQGKGIATLAQLRADPTLLDGFKVAGSTCKYDVDTAQAAQAEILLAMPLSGLSGRMRFLEDALLFGYDRINLAIRAADVLDRFEQIKAGPVRVWNGAPGKGGVMPPSPTRALRQLLPTEEGGTDTQKRLQLFNWQLLPDAAIKQGFVEEKLSHADLPIDDVERRLAYLAQTIWLSYIATPRQELIRGRLDDCIKRPNRIQLVVEDARDNAPPQADIAKWRQRVRAAYLTQDEAKKAAALAEIWGEDQWLLHLVNEPDEEPPNPRLVPKKLLSDIVLSAVNEPLHLDCDYLLALRWQEKAERLRVQTSLTAGANGTHAEKVKHDAKSAWTNADSWWTDYSHDNRLTVETFRARLETVKKHLKTGKPALAVGLLDDYGKITRTAAAAKLLQARALKEAGRTDSAALALKKLDEDLLALEKEANLDRSWWPPFINTAPVNQREAIRKAVDAYFTDFGPSGSLYWMRFAANIPPASRGGP